MRDGVHAASGEIAGFRPIADQDISFTHATCTSPSPASRISASTVSRGQ